MKRKFIIDTSVYISFSRYNKINRLVQAIAKNKLYVYTNQKLIGELEKNSPLTLKDKTIEPQLIIQTIKLATFYVETVEMFNDCP